MRSPFRPHCRNEDRRRFLASHSSGEWQECRVANRSASHSHLGSSRTPPAIQPIRAPAWRESPPRSAYPDARDLASQNGDGGQSRITVRRLRQYEAEGPRDCRLTTHRSRLLLGLKRHAYCHGWAILVEISQSVASRRRTASTRKRLPNLDVEPGRRWSDHPTSRADPSVNQRELHLCDFGRKRKRA